MHIPSEVRKLDLLLWVHILTSSSQFLWQIINFSKLVQGLVNFEQLGPFLRDFLSLTFSEYFSEPNPIFYRVSKVMHTYY
jgi:hypothetical protein